MNKPGFYNKKYVLEEVKVIMKIICYKNYEVELSYALWSEAT